MRSKFDPYNSVWPGGRFAVDKIPDWMYEEKPVKNEHIVWAYAEKKDGTGQVLVIGLTDDGLDFLKAGEGAEKKTLVVHPPGKGFRNVVEVVIFNEKDKATLKERLREANMLVSEVN